jgi:hypothetical protein
MRRVIGLVLAGLGAILIVGAVLVRTVVSGQVVKFPLSENLTSGLRGTGVSYFSPSKLRPETGATIRVTSTVQGDPSAGDSSTAVWNTSTSLYDVTHSLPLESSTRRIAFNRRTAELVDCCGASVGGNKAIRQSGLVGFLWPIGTRQTTYQVFDSGLNKARPARFAGTATVDGIKVDKFVEHVPRTKSGTQAVPGALIGLPGSPVVTLTEYYTATNTFWVDPVTGAQLNTHEDQEVTIQDATGAHRLLLFDGVLATTPPSIRAAVALDNTGRSELTLLRVIIPLACGLAGIVALVAGILLARRREDDRPDTADAQPGLDPAPAP